jgi:hypothetical protein
MKDEANETGNRSWLPVLILRPRAKLPMAQAGAHLRDAQASNPETTID